MRFAPTSRREEDKNKLPNLVIPAEVLGFPRSVTYVSTVSGHFKTSAPEYQSYALLYQNCSLPQLSAGYCTFFGLILSDGILATHASGLYLCSASSENGMGATWDRQLCGRAWDAGAASRQQIEVGVYQSEA